MKKIDHVTVVENKDETKDETKLVRSLRTSNFGESLRSRVITDQEAWDSRLLGALNENEYSASLYFDKPRLPRNLYQRVRSFTTMAVTILKII